VLMLIDTFLPRCMECRRSLAKAMRILSVCLSVRPFVRPTNAWIVTKRICLDFHTIRKIIYPSFLRKRMVGGSDPFYLKFRVNRPPWSEIANFEQIITRSGSVVTPSEKSSTNTMRFPMSLR